MALSVVALFYNIGTPLSNLTQPIAIKYRINQVFIYSMGGFMESSFDVKI
jgi:hypothetical protein